MEKEYSQEEIYSKIAFGRLMRLARQAKNMSLREVSDKTGIRVVCLSGYETNVRPETVECPPLSSELATKISSTIGIPQELAEVVIFNQNKPNVNEI